MRCLRKKLKQITLNSKCHKRRKDKDIIQPQGGEKVKSDAPNNAQF